MKSSFHVCNFYSSSSVGEIRRAIAKNEGIVACHIDSDSSEINVVYNEKIVSLDDIIQSVEDAGYTTY